MTGYDLLNLGSLALGLAAWALPIVVIFKGGRKRQGGFFAASASACAAALYMQIIYQSHLVKIEDWSAVMDTSGPVARVSSVLAAGTIALNAIALFARRGERAKRKSPL